MAKLKSDICILSKNENNRYKDVIATLNMNR